MIATVYLAPGHVPAGEPRARDVEIGEIVHEYTPSRVIACEYIPGDKTGRGEAEVYRVLDIRPDGAYELMATTDSMTNAITACAVRNRIDPHTGEDR